MLYLFECVGGGDGGVVEREQSENCLSVAIIV